MKWFKVTQYHLVIKEEIASKIMSLTDIERDGIKTDDLRALDKCYNIGDTCILGAFLVFNRIATPEDKLVWYDVNLPTGEMVISNNDKFPKAMPKEDISKLEKLTLGQSLTVNGSTYTKIQ